MDMHLYSTLIKFILSKRLEVHRYTVINSYIRPTPLHVPGWNETLSTPGRGSTPHYIDWVAKKKNF